MTNVMQAEQPIAQTKLKETKENKPSVVQNVQEVTPNGVYNHSDMHTEQWQWNTAATPVAPLGM
jgi:hypothetical protein